MCRQYCATCVPVKDRLQRRHVHLSDSPAHDRRRTIPGSHARLRPSASPTRQHTKSTGRRVSHISMQKRAHI